jgi:hypothetical protein
VLPGLSFPVLAFALPERWNSLLRCKGKKMHGIELTVLLTIFDIEA